MSKYRVVLYFDYDGVLDGFAFLLDDNGCMSEFDEKCYTDALKDFEIYSDRVMLEDKVHDLFERMRNHHQSLPRW